MKLQSSLLLLLTIFSIPVNGNEPPQYSQKIYQAYISGDMNYWEKTVVEMEQTKVDNKLNLLNFYYGLSGYLIATKKKKKAAIYVSKGERIIDELLQHEANATVIAYKAAFMGFRIGLNKLAAITIGPKSIALSKQALKMDSLNTRSLNERANVLYYSPSFAGGDKHEALRLYEKAIKIMRAQADTLKNWNYLSLLANTGQAFLRNGDKQKARLYYEMALQNESEFKWVSEQLLPSLK